MSLEDYSCDMFELEILFTLEDFDRTAFLKDVQTEDKPRYSWLYGSLEKPHKQHANIRLRFSEKRKCSLGITYHKSDFEVKDARPPHMEDCAQWIGQFFKNDEWPTTIRMAFAFDKTFSPIFALPFPLVSESKILSGSKVTGVSIELPVQTKLEQVYIQKYRENTIIIATTSSKVRLKSFDLNSELDKFSKPIRSLIRRVVTEDDTES